MNYDFSRMNVAAATSKRTEGQGGEGRQGGDGERRGPPRQGPPAGFDDDDFEVVREAKKRGNRRPAEEPSFGGGMPMFTRGGK